MPAQENKITLRQAVIIFIASTLSPTIRLFPNLCSKEGKTAGWLAPAFSAIALIILFCILHEYFKSKKYVNLSDVFNAILGKAAGKILLFVFLLWLILLYFLYIKYYADRLLSSIFPDTDIRFFILTMSCLVFLSARGKIETFARFSELAYLLFTFVLIIYFIMLIPTCRLNNLFPVTYHDIIPAAKATYPIMGIWGYIIFIFFLGDNIIDIDMVKRYGKKSTAFLVVMTTLIMLTVVGSLSWQVAHRMSLPFFSTSKLIEIIEFFNRFESVLLSLWVVADFIVISFFAKLVINIAKKLFEVSESKYFASPVVLMGYIGSLYLAQTRMELEKFSLYIGLPVNIAICFLIPIFVFIIGKLRKKI